jgi:DNA-binding response OmpR family regulator
VLYEEDIIRVMEKKILVVEDDPTSRKFLELILKKEGYQVVTAANGLEGHRKVGEESPDILILDVMLPGIDGFEICHRIRSKTGNVRLPIILMSAKVQESDRDAALKVGADAFLSKPVDRVVLLNKITELLGSRKDPETA